MDKILDEALKELFEEAAIGKVMINDEVFDIAFSTFIIFPDNTKYATPNNDSFPNLHINNYPLFRSKLLECIELQQERTKNYYRTPKDRVKFLVAYTFANATFNDFSNPYQYLNRVIEFLNNPTLTDIDESIDLTETQILANEVLVESQKQSIYMETPNKMTFTLHGNIGGVDYTYKLPEISYGICTENNEQVCYIYSSLNPENIQVDNEVMNHIYKKVQRSLYQVNKTVSNDPNSLNLSPSSIVSMSLFLGLLDRIGITRIKVVDYQPVRYNSRELRAEILTNMTEQLQERNDKIQTNATDRFTNIFIRLTNQLSNLQYNGTLDDNILRFQINPLNEENNDLVNTLYSRIKNKKNKTII